MGMFDYFNPRSLLCPRCGQHLADFQGKPADCDMYVWQENERHPVEHRVDPEYRTGKIHHATLAADVVIYGDCSACGFGIYAKAVVRDHLWCDTVLTGTVYDALPIENLYFICGNCNHCCDRLHAGTFHLCPQCHEANRTIPSPAPANPPPGSVP